MSTSINKIIGENLRTIRENKKRKALDIATELGISESAYTKYERGETPINPTRAFQLADIFNVSVHEILLPLEHCHIENSFHNSSISGTLSGTILNPTINSNALSASLLKIIEQNSESNRMVNEALAEISKTINLLLSRQ